MKYRFFIITILFLVYSCKKDTTKISLHQDYYDLTPGRYVEYQVMEIDHNVNHIIPHDTLRYYLRTVIGDTFIDNEGKIAREFIRYKRGALTEQWVQSDLWTTIISDSKAQLVEENQRVVKLIFPPAKGKEWDANAMNMQGKFLSYYKSVHVPYSIGNFAFDSTLVVEQDDFFSMIDYRRKYEVYAKNIGLVYKYYKDLQISSFDTLNIQQGTELFYTCIGYGIQ